LFVADEPSWDAFISQGVADNSKKNDIRRTIWRLGDIIDCGFIFVVNRLHILIHYMVAIKET
jgi:hypothetical protein